MVFDGLLAHRGTRNISHLRPRSSRARVSAQAQKGKGKGNGAAKV